MSNKPFFTATVINSDGAMTNFAHRISRDGFFVGGVQRHVIPASCSLPESLQVLRITTANQQPSIKILTGYKK